MLVPNHIGWHLAHHVDAGVPMANLPKLHRELRRAGYVTDELEYPSYLSLWRKLSSASIAA
jgi:fatty acid desaturase